MGANIAAAILEVQGRRIPDGDLAEVQSLRDALRTWSSGESDAGANIAQQAVAALEGAEACAAYASGMAALRAVLEAQSLRPGDRMVMPADDYGATMALFKAFLAPRQVELHPLLLSEMDAPGK